MGGRRVLIREHEAEGDALGPEAGVVEARRRGTVRAAARAEGRVDRDLRRVDDAIDLPAGAHDAGPEREGVADAGTQPWRELVADVHACLGHDAEGRVVPAADVGRLGQDGAVNEDELLRPAEGDLAKQTDAEVVFLPDNAAAELPPVKGVVRAEAIDVE